MSLYFLIEIMEIMTNNDNDKSILVVKEDYYLTPDKLWIPLRWIAPELLEEYRGSLIVTDQTKTSNVWYVLKPSQTMS